MKQHIDDMLSEVYAHTLLQPDSRAELIRLAGRERITSDLDVVAFYLARLALGGSQLAAETLRQFIELERAA